MLPVKGRDAGVWQQTKGLLYKNLLIKWRTKQQSLQELILPLLLLGLLILISTLHPHVYYHGISTVELERQYSYDPEPKYLGYTPNNTVTNRIMDKVAEHLTNEGIEVEMFHSEKALENASLHDQSSWVGVVFQNSLSYQLRFPYNSVPLPSDYTDSIASCFTDSKSCKAANYWYSGFTKLQSYIDAAIIEVQTQREVWREMEGLRVVMMGQPGSVEVQKFPHALISIYLVLAFTPFVSFLIVNVAAEKECRLKDAMAMMGLRDSAFWLSWGLLYAALVSTMSVLMAIISTCTSLFPRSSFFVIFLLIFLYGISTIFFSFMLTPLFKKPKFASTVGSMLTVVFGCLSLFTVLMKDFPQPLVWVLCLLSPSAFSIGIAQVVYLEAQGDGAVFSALSNGPHPLFVPLVMLVLDSFLYLLLAVYLDQVLPREYGIRRSILYFLKPSYWSRHMKHYKEVSSRFESEVNGVPPSSESVEPVSSEFQGKEAIRINNIHKVYKEKDSSVEALRGLTFDIYEGQITALLGHSGAGKSTLMNILCGICRPTEGSAMIYGSPVSEMAEGLEMRRLVGICPQFNIMFEVLTVEENLRIFAAIKGIPPGEYGIRRSILYFLKPSYWSRHMKHYKEVSSRFESEVNGVPPSSESVEPVSSEFQGKEAIRINNIHKVYKEKDSSVEALRGLTFDIYEGQITALLGHSGAGKSTLMNILCGICRPTEGSAMIYGSPVSEMAEGLEMRRLVGICPQFNIMFEVLTVEENLRIFAAIKGIPPGDINREVAKVLKDLDLEKIMDAQAKNLSGGQKRKLSVGIAILGDPKILLLDEPTAGMDPCSRHQVWSLLKSRRSDRVTVLSTHYMDEADILADRKAVLSQGLLRCIGSSLYLKTKCGVGYHLRMSVTESCDTDHMTSLIKQHISKAQLSRQQEAELTYTLPFENMDTFSGLFSELDSRPDLGIENYGVSMTTLEDVFLKLEAEAEVDQADYSVFNQEQVEEEGYASSLDDTDQQLLVFSDSKSEGVSGHALWRQQFRTIARLHLLNLQRERKPIILALFVIFLASVLALSLISGNIRINATTRRLSPDLYLLSSKQPLSNTKVHSLPMLLNILSNALLHSLNGTGRIETWSKPFEFKIPEALSSALIYIEAVLLGMLAAGMPAYFAMEHTRDREIKCRSQLRISGLVPSAYWCGQAAVDIPFYYLILIAMTSTLFAFHSEELLHAGAYTSVIPCLIGYGPAMILFTYVVSFMFTRVQNNRDFLSVVSMLVCVVSAFLVQLTYVNENQVVATILHNSLCFFNPLYPLMGCLNCITKKTFTDMSIYEDTGTLSRNMLVTIVSKPVVVVSSLRKEYSTRHDGFIFNTKKKKVATRNISLCVRKGEVLGLLGPNGAGKTTTMYMLAGETEPTAGQVLMGDYCTEFRQVDSTLEYIGYCPQVNPLWPKITLQEHLEIYASIKGLGQNEVAGIIKRVVNALELKEHLKKKSKSLSAGIKRKLCFALSMLGNPQIVLLDEPSTGMDPKAKQRMWRAIRAAFKNRPRGAILTTHYMEEAEAVCDRVAIMVSGQLRFATLMVYKIPMEDVKSLSESFSQLEKAKDSFHFEEYNFSQATLEQVFLEFAKEQENDEEEIGSLSTTFQWQRLQQDEPVSTPHSDSIVHQL
ncbi:UNVERIFIED_CONTAM: hypothetical protein FKN15_052353 [Acipenser sinensis]